MEAVETTADLTLLTWVNDGGRHDTTALVEEAYRTLDDALRDAGAVVVQERVFGRLDVADEVLRARGRATRPDNEAWAVPPTYIEGAPVQGAEVAGIHVLAARAQRHRLIEQDGIVAGRVVETPDAVLVGLFDVGRLGVIAPSSPADDAAMAIDGAERLLVAQGFTFRDVVRTWYHLRDILSWYGPFNGARNAAFRRMGLIGPDGDGAVPASTGIAGRNARGGWCALDLIAARGRAGGRFEMHRLHNRRQNEATEYGSAFARGMALTLGDHKHLFVSGTASIDDHGATAHVGDFDAQARHTIEAVQSLLEGAGASIDDVRQAMVFVKDPADADRFARLARRYRLDRIPPVTIEAAVCRDQLLVEIEATAVVPVGPRR